MKNIVDKFSAGLFYFVGIYLLLAFLLNLFIAYQDNTKNSEDAIRKDIVRTANKYLTDPVFKDQGNKTDCSSFTQNVYKQNGISIPGSVKEQLEKAQKSPACYQAGDLIFFSIDNNKVSHVGILINDSTFIHSPGKGKDVQQASLKHPYWSVRVNSCGSYGE